MPDFLDEQAQQDLDVFIGLYKSQTKTKQWWNDLIQADRRVSQWIEHGRVSPDMKQKLITTFHEIDGWLVKNAKS